MSRGGEIVVGEAFWGGVELGGMQQNLSKKKLYPNINYRLFRGGVLITFF